MSVAPLKSIQKKLVASSVIILASALLGFLVTVIFLSISQISQQKRSSEASIRHALMDQGEILVKNNSQALSGMVEDNAILSVTNLVAMTVNDNVVYGIYMDAKRQPWVLANQEHPDGIITNPGALEDSMSLWASGITDFSFREFRMASGPVIEFAAPVRVVGVPMGVIRYGLSLTQMNRDIEVAARSAKRTLKETVTLLILFGSMALLLAYFWARILSAKITKPIEELQVAANIIAKGDYSRPLSISSDDEIGLLATDFEEMRSTVKVYTERLEEMVEEKVQEIKDVLNNIEQGLFTVDLKGKINPSYALSTNAILGVDDVAKHTLDEVLHLSSSQTADWMNWLEMVKLRYTHLRWEKIERLCPIRELHLADKVSGNRIILVSNQKMCDGHNELHGMMILVQDVTEIRRIEQSAKLEAMRHENEVKSILGIVRFSAAIPDFLADLNSRFKNIAADILAAPNATGSALFQILRNLSRDLHTVKGTAGTFGFMELSQLAGKAEEVLAGNRDVRVPEENQEWLALTALLEHMQAESFRIYHLVDSLKISHGEDMVSIPASRIRAIMEWGKNVEQANRLEPEMIEKILKACKEINFVRLSVLADKYRALLERLAVKLEKKIEFMVRPEEMELSPRLFSALDEPLIHLLRNSADHGIENSDRRMLAGKPVVGRIILEFKRRIGFLEVMVTDDGGGIDTERLARKAIANGLISPSALKDMDDSAKASLIFLPGLSSRENVTEISGRGVGMDAVAEWVKSAGGSIVVSAVSDGGTQFCLKLPSAFEG